jgi:hypothetical protein
VSASSSSTIKVEMDSRLLDELRVRHPGKDDRALLEELARIEIGFDTLADVQRRSDASPEETRRQAVQAVRETRAEST